MITAEVPPLQRSLRSHVAADSQALAQYRLLAEVAVDSKERQLLEVIVANKDRTLELLHDMLAAPTVAQPALPAREAGSKMAIIRALIRHERASALRLRHLARQDPAPSGLYGLVLEMMARESETHARVLHLLMHRIGDAAAEARPAR